MFEGDSETRARLLAAAARLFAREGFDKVTVREICREAGANVAAVNYYFGDKLGLYRQVLAKAVETMRATTDAARRAGEGRVVEDRLRAYVRVFLERVVAQGGDSWIHQLMQQEMADPTPALDLVVDQVIRPRMAYLSELVGELLDRPPDDPEVLRSVLSVQAQCHMLMANPVSRRLAPAFVGDPASIQAHAEHIAEFSLGGIRLLRDRHAAPLSRR